LDQGRAALAAERQQPHQLPVRLLPPGIQRNLAGKCSPGLAGIALALGIAGQVV
jgi:hypothetical protein